MKMEKWESYKATRSDRERRLQDAVENFEFEDPQDGTGFDNAFLDAIAALKREFGPLSNRLVDNERLLNAVRAVYYYGHWTTNKSAFASLSIEEQLWTELRDAAGFEPGKSSK